MPKPADETADIIVHSLDEIPDFHDENEEFEYWAGHRFGPEILDQMGSLPDDARPQPQPQSVSLSLGGHTLARVKALAKRRHVGDQALLTEFITERLYEEEKREGLIH